jgi:lysylphosphatidylglycerol synthetase-like protein (DUF2156 family)
LAFLILTGATLIVILLKESLGKLLGIALSVRTVLQLAALVLIIIAAITLVILKKDIFPKLKKNHAFILLAIIVIALAVLAALIIRGVFSEHKEKPGPTIEEMIRVTGDKPIIGMRVRNIPRPEFPSVEQKRTYKSSNRASRNSLLSQAGKE